MGQQSIGAAVTTTPVRAPTNQIRISGSDTISLIPDISTAGPASGDEVLNVRILPSISPRLAQHAVCYNEVKYHSLVAKINGQASSLTVGSAILAFCSDPADVVPKGTDAITWARSQRCNRSAKYWETMRVVIPANQMIGPNDGYFKNNVGRSEAPRTYSPGFLSLVVISPANQPTPLELQLEWDVTLRNPTLNNAVDEGAGVVTSDVSFGVQGSSIADTPYIAALRAFPVGEAARDLVASDFSPPLQSGARYELPGGQLTITGNTGSTGAPTATIATHLGLSGSTVVLFRYLISSQSYEAIDNNVISAQPLPDAAPTFRAPEDFVADPDTLPASPVGFRLVQPRPSSSARLPMRGSPAG